MMIWWYRFIIMLRWRISLFRDLYLFRFFIFNIIIWLGYFTNGIGFWNCLLIDFIIFFVFLFADIMSPGNNPVKETLDGMRSNDKDWLDLDKKNYRDKRIDEILK
jgi:hypothetical protein